MGFKYKNCDVEVIFFIIVIIIIVFIIIAFSPWKESKHRNTLDWVNTLWVVRFSHTHTHTTE